MIRLERVTKSYPTRFGRHYVIRDVSAVFPGEKNIAILGRNGAGKSTLLRMLGGIDFPDRGAITSTKRISWPLALATGFQGSMTGRDNCRFVARVLGQHNLRQIEKYVRDFSEIGKKFDLPVNNLSSGEKSRIAFGLSMAFKFDLYLLDEVTSVGDPAFRKKAKAALDERRKNANIIMVSHVPSQLREFGCDIGIVLHDGNMKIYDDLDKAVAAYETLAEARRL